MSLQIWRQYGDLKAISKKKFLQCHEVDNNLREITILRPVVDALKYAKQFSIFDLVWNLVQIMLHNTFYVWVAMWYLYPHTRYVCTAICPIKKQANSINTLDLHLFIISINSFLPIPVSRKASAALKLGMLSYGCSANNMTCMRRRISC